MKRILLISLWGLILAVALSSCGDKTIEEREVELEEAKKEAELEATKGQRDAQSQLDKCYVVNRDGCEYLLFGKWASKRGYGYLTHKGDCTNPIHEHNK